MSQLDDYSELLASLGPHARQLVQSTWLEATRSFTPDGLTRYLEGACEIPTAGLGWSVALAYLRETPAEAGELGEDPTFNTLDTARAGYVRPYGRPSEQGFAIAHISTHST